MIAVSGLCVAAGKFRLSDVSFRVEAGAHAVLSGPSGSGKTTTLEAICGLRRIVSGKIEIAGREVTDLPPAARQIGFVPQDGALFPHLNVRENAGFALRVRRRPPAEIAARVEELARPLGLTNLLDRRVTDLSGGEKQRVALARALAFRPPVLLLDEPFSALDRNARLELRGMLQRLRSEQGVTILHVTHDAADAESLATQIIEHSRP
jgi:ABC-type sugar transport system ATPase subunit